MFSQNGNEDFSVDFTNQDVFKVSLLNGPSASHINFLNKLLSTSKNFTRGLELLNRFVDFCCVELIGDYVVNWIECCLKHSGNNFTYIKLSIIGKLIETSSTSHDISKKIVSDYLPKIVELCVKNNDEVLSAINVLIICMKTYGSWFTSQKMRIENFITSFLKNGTEVITKKAAVAFLVLQQVGNTGIDGINYRKNFHDSLQRLCKTFHNLLDEFFENRVNIDDIEKPDLEGFNFDNSSSSSQHNIQVIAQYIKNVIIFIKVMIEESFPVCKDILPMDIINIINRGTTVHHCLTATTDNSLEDYQFSLNLNQIQVQLMQLLRILIVWLQNDSLPFAFNISKILIDCLKKSQNCKCFDRDVSYRESVYLTFKYWITYSRTGLNTYFQDQLVVCILKDITPVKHSVILKIQMDKKNNLVHKNKTIKNIVSQNESNDYTKSTRERDEFRCQLALKTLSTLFSHGYVRLEDKVIQDICNLILNILNEINTSVVPYPYTNEKCQSNLFGLLVALYEQETLSNLPSISLSLNIFNDYSCHRNSDIAASSKQGINNIEKICQPISCPFNSFSSATVLKPREEEVEKAFFLENVTDLTKQSSDIIVLNHIVITPDKKSCDDEITIDITKEVIEEEENIEAIEKKSMKDIHESTKVEYRIEEIVTASECDNSSFPIIPGQQFTEESINITQSSTETLIESKSSSENVCSERESPVENANDSDITSRSEDEPLAKKLKTDADHIETSTKPPETEIIDMAFEELHASFVDEVRES